MVTGVAHAAAVARQLPDLPEANILVEPSPAGLLRRDRAGRGDRSPGATRRR